MKTTQSSKSTFFARLGLAAAIVLMACDIGTAATQAPAATQASANTPAPAATTVPVSNVAKPTVVSGAGDIQAVVDQYRTLLGNNNGGVPGSQTTGRRELNWDGITDDLSAPNLYLGNFFNGAQEPLARGIVLTTPGTGLMVSAANTNPTNTLPRFGNINPTYADIFKTFSAEKLFSPIGSNIVEATFFVPGTQTPALIRGFGAVYTDVDTEHTAFEYFDQNGASLGQFAVPTADNGLSFLGVAFDQPIVAKVKISYGTVALGPNDDATHDVAVMDDFIYGEPVAGGNPVAAATASGNTPTSAPANTTTGFVQDGAAVNRDPSQAAQSPALAAGTTTAGGPKATWVAWAENVQGGARQVFVSQFVDGAFQPRGASLNIHQNAVGDEPGITFAGADFAIPWAAWVEPSPSFDNVSQLFASRFDTATGLWQPAGQDRGGGETSLNLNTGKPANHPVIVGGSGDPTTPPTPWLAWEEDGSKSNFVQIFVAKGVKDDTAIGGFHWEPVGVNNKNDEPSLNIDPKRDSQTPSLVFAETGNAVPWVTWYELGAGRPSQVFTARGVLDAKAPGGFKWTSVPPCTPDENACSLNTNPLKDAEDPTMAAGSVTAGESAVPWITWSEVGPSGKAQIFVSRLDTSTRNSFLNVGASLNVDQNHNAQTPFIAFVGNVPYVAWLEDDGTGRLNVQVRHLASDPQTGTWALDTPAKGFNFNQALNDSALSATSDGTSLIMSWVEGDPTKEASQVVVGHLTP